MNRKIAYKIAILIYAVCLYRPLQQKLYFLMDISKIKMPETHSSTSLLNKNFSSYLPDVIDDLAKLRLKADLTLLPNHPYFSDKPYPLGRCREIRDHVFKLLLQELKKPKTLGIKVIVEYLNQGHSLTKIWGGLRDMYFQNAIHLGEYYIDVSNDTVNPNKPRIEIALMKNSGFSEITDFEKFAQIAKVYWEVDVYSNSVCSSLAPFMPILCVDRQGKSWIATNDAMLKVAQESAFKKSERIINALPTPSEKILAKWQAFLDEQDIQCLNNNASAEAYCQQYREDSLHQNIAFRNTMVEAFMKINRPV